MSSKHQACFTLSELTFSYLESPVGKAELPAYSKLDIASLKRSIC